MNYGTADSLQRNPRPRLRPEARIWAGIMVSKFVPKVNSRVVPDAVVGMIPKTTLETIQKTAMMMTCETTTETALTTTA